MSDIDKNFSGSIPKLYESHLVPLIFEPYAVDLKRRVGAMSVSRILEVAAGTGVVTRALASLPNERMTIVATDLNQAMLDQAAVTGTARPVHWQQADAMALPFSDGEFDVVVCQFGVMFFPDKIKAFSEARRVLRPGGVFLFNVWDSLKDNEFADTIASVMAAAFPDDPPRFLARTPYGYHDRSAIAQELAAAGFTKVPQIDTLAASSWAPTARDAAIAYCQGTPLRSEVEARDASRLAEVTDKAAEAIQHRFGRIGVSGRIQALVVTVEK